ncbi:MAG: hypothetical protein Q8K15_02445, partial [Candidatus Omnitrophota bacterium]|nr:hypothetical protein [Candidatus Omnitrophota bacterium]
GIFKEERIMRDSKGVVLFIVLGLILVVVVLAAVILSIISSQSRLTHHQVSRIKAYYAGKGMMNYASDMLRKGNWVPNASGGANKYACHRNCIDSGVSATYTIPIDNDIPYNIQVTIHPDKTGPGGVTAQLDIKTDYAPQ